MLQYRNKDDYNGAFTYKGIISSAEDFPTSGTVENGWAYKLGDDVVDNNETKTNTGISFKKNDNGIVWSNGTWIIFQIIEASEHFEEEFGYYWICQLIDSNLKFKMPNPRNPAVQFADVYEQIV